MPTSTKITRVALREFTTYMNSFYGPEGVYPSERTLTIGEVTNAVLNMVNGTGNTFEGDSVDRERVRDILFTSKEQEAMYGN